MVQFDNQLRQVKIKVVYYGPALGGKTSCLQHIHRVADPQRRTKLYALNTASDRTLFFDLLALDLGKVRGYRLTLQLFTVPGQVQYDATRRAVLAGADGVVFVADSQPAQREANVESLGNLATNLIANGLDPGAIPLVLQYNKRDLADAVPVDEMGRALNERVVPAFETVATTGRGVIEAFAAVTGQTVRSVAERLGLGAQPAVERLMENVRTAFDPLLSRATGQAAEAPVVLRQANTEATLSQQELVGEAVRANMAMADLNVRLEEVSRQLERRVGQLGAVNQFGHAAALAREPEEVTTQFLDRFLADLRVGCGSLALVDDAGGVVEALRRGLDADPLQRGDDTGRPSIASVARTRRAETVRLDDLPEETVQGDPGLAGMRSLGLCSALAVPLVSRDRTLGVATAFADAARGDFDDADLELATALAATAAAALAGARAWRALEDVNRSLEARVEERTRELAEALQRAEALAAALEERAVVLEGANSQLRRLEDLKSGILNRVAHELNTPVASIRTAAGILSRYRELSVEKAEQFVGIIQRESGRLGELIASALEATLLDSSEVGTPERVKVADLLRASVAPFKGEIEARKIAFSVRVATGLVHVMGRAEQLEAALRAVVKNAVEFNREEGSVNITLRPVRRDNSPFVELRVEDTGTGIPADELEHVTEVLWQGGGVLTGKPRGLGLGLAVARRVAEGHGGCLEITSEPGRGTEVSIFVPERMGDEA